MTDTPAKIIWTLGTYVEARRAVRRQFDPGVIRRVQNSRLQSLIRHCAGNIKYYQELFQQAGIDPGQIRTTNDLPRIPLLTKEQLRNRFWDFLPRRLPACRVSRTSGSTGIPVCILADWHSRKCNSAAVIRFRKAVGIPLIGRSFITLLNTDTDPPRPAQWTFLQGVHKQHFLNPYINSPDNTAYVRRLATKLGNPVLTGITSSVRALAQGMRDGVFPPLRPALVMTGGEMLLPQVRELIENTFATRVLDVYACNEARDIAWQCRQARGYHINADNVIVEILKDGRAATAGEIGAVVLTDLNRHVMPIIRYQNGDLARWSDEVCPCGCRLPMLAEIIGRTGENIVLPDGRRVLWNRLKGLMNHPQIRQFSLVQQRDGSLTVRYVPQSGADIEQLDHLLLSRFRRATANSLQITLDKTASIPPGPSGKSKLVVSYYDPPCATPINHDAEVV
jgi:phenylacetate-CoA ligase